MPSKQPKFELAADNRKNAPQNDEPGTIVVKVFLSGKGHRPVKGNVSKSIRLTDCKVSEVHKAILEALT